MVDRLEGLLSDRVLREELGAKAEARSREFSWPQSAAAMQAVLDTVHAGRRVSGVIQL
jgi:glycosyltransferase involved in cell wall biosynthesis